ncbi:NnrU family protein [Shewanella submarina]|uniref:NnrU family protein n=1 Tax=Shewanella submarina TaxID=2016376 RepID=A0ABV7G8E4_9GAMM|nr:NnrU family protein [Shewanella submarina]MCL1038319.1 NnrU family protein [Shewanella submarina]
MLYLILGVLLWSLTHLLPSLAPNWRAAQLASSVGRYKGLFSLSILISLGLIVYGWRHTPVEYLYVAGMGMRHATMSLMLVAFILFGASMYPTRIKRLIRHPMLMSVVVWAVAHMLSNGESRSLVLFGGLGAWALVQMLLINRRDGDWVKPDVGSWVREIRGAVISLVIMVAAVWLHPYFAGVALLPG